MLTKPTRSAINLGVPTVATGITSFLLLKAGKDWKFMLIAGVIVFLGVWAITSQLTKIAMTQGPAPVPTGGGCDSYDPQPLIDAIYRDIDCFWCTRNNDLYNTLLGLSDCQIRKAYNYWNAKYYSSTGQSLPIAINQEGSAWDSGFDEQKQALLSKFSTLNLQ